MSDCVGTDCLPAVHFFVKIAIFELLHCLEFKADPYYLGMNPVFHFP